MRHSPVCVIILLILYVINTEFLEVKMDIGNMTINAIRFLCAEAVENAKSGHPGMPLGMASAAYELWADHLKHNPKNPEWADRDRFILSGGHGSTLLYSLLHLFGYGLTIEDLKNFRKFGSATPGHPEYGHTKGVEITTGPLGQGFASGIGMALAENYLAAKFNKPEHKIVDHYTYIFCGDGDMMEGISHEAASLAGTLGLNKVIVLYDSNDITIEGPTEIAFTENVRMRFDAYGWNTLFVGDGNDTEKISDAIIAAKKSCRPTLIEIKTVIGYGAPNKAGKAAAHGEPLGRAEIDSMKTALGWNYGEFEVPNEVYENQKIIIEKLSKKEEEWNALYKKYESEYPDSASEWEAWHSKKLPVDLLNEDDFWSYEGDTATRISSEQVLNKVCKLVPNLIGGAADLAPSTKTLMKGRGDYSKNNPAGANLHFGVRELAMTSIANGIAAHGGLRPYIAGFYVFSDYMKPAMRLSASMGLSVINILTHDSIGVGEDGPTHQPVEQLASLRSIPNFTVIRPCDTNETAAAWYLALTRTNSPTALVLSRQTLPILPGTGKPALRGAYVLRESKKEKPDIILIATGSEVQLIYEAYDILNEKNISARVVSMPSWEIFEEQPEEYKQKVLPETIRARLAVEALSPFGWERYTGLDGGIISVNRFGASGSYQTLFKEFGFTAERVAGEAEKIIGKLKND